MRYLYSNKGRDQAIYRLQVILSINKQLNNLTIKIYKAYKQKRKLLNKKGKPVIIIYYYIGTIEKYIYYKQAKEAYIQVIKEHYLLYYNKEEANALEQEVDFIGKLSRDKVPLAIYNLITAIYI